MSGIGPDSLGKTKQSRRSGFWSPADVSDRTEFEALVYNIRLKYRLPFQLSPLQVGLIVPLVVFGSGFIIAAVVGEFEAFFQSHAVYIFTLDLLVALWALFWLEQAIPETVIKISSAFETPAAEYYQFMSQFLTRCYRPLPYADFEGRSRIHVPSLVAISLGILVFGIIPAWRAPTLFSQALGMEWVSLHPLLKAYVFGLITFAVVVGVVVSWIVLVTAWYMGIEARDLQIKLDVTRIKDNLGLGPYAQTVFIASCAYLLVYIISTSIFIFIKLNAFIVIGLTVMSLLPFIGFLGSQYGLHVAIRRSKDRRLRRLREEFDHEVRLWFMNEEPLPSSTDESDLVDFMAAKQAIEELPEWPIRMRSVTQLISATLASNVWVVLQLAGVIG